MSKGKKKDKRLGAGLGTAGLSIQSLVGSLRRAPVGERSRALHATAFLLAAVVYEHRLNDKTAMYALGVLAGASGLDWPEAHRTVAEGFDAGASYACK